jgi:integrin alpha FG-GAP repeat containing protein 1
MPEVTNNGPSGLFSGYTLFTSSPDITILKNADGLYSHPLVKDFIPGQLRTGDVDSDGYLDLIATFKDKSGNPVTTILINSECGGEDISNSIKRNLAEGDIECTTRTFDTTNDYSEISDISNSMYAFFVDFDDNGKIDFVVVKLGDSQTSVLKTYYNNFSRDSYYITATSYTTSSSSYGSKLFAASYRGIFTTLNDKQKVFVAHQITRTAYGALEQPIAMYVIGRSNNYIEDFTLSYPIQIYSDNGARKELSVESNSWSPIIPNSHLLIDINEKSSSNWNIRLLINPADSFLLVGIILSLILIIIGGIIIYIHMKEKKEDEEFRNPQLDFF